MLLLKTKYNENKENIAIRRKQNLQNNKKTIYLCYHKKGL